MDKLNAGETWFETEDLQVVCTHDAVEVRLPNHTGRLTYALGAAAHWLDERLGGVRPSERVWLLRPDRQSAKIAAGVAQAILSSGDRDAFAVLGEWTARSDEELAALLACHRRRRARGRLGTESTRRARRRPPALREDRRQADRSRSGRRNAEATGRRQRRPRQRVRLPRTPRRPTTLRGDLALPAVGASSGSG